MQMLTWYNGQLSLSEAESLHGLLQGGEGQGKDPRGGLLVPDGGFGLPVAVRLAVRVGRGRFGLVDVWSGDMVAHAARTNLLKRS